MFVCEKEIWLNIDIVSVSKSKCLYSIVTFTFIDSVCPQREKRWSCDASCCRADDEVGLEVESGVFWTAPLPWSADLARASKNVSKSKMQASYSYSTFRFVWKLINYIFAAKEKAHLHWIPHHKLKAALPVFQDIIKTRFIKHPSSFRLFRTHIRERKGFPHRVTWQPSVNVILHRVVRWCHLRRNVQKSGDTDYKRDAAFVVFYGYRGNVSDDELHTPAVTCNLVSRAPARPSTAPGSSYLTLTRGCSEDLHFR